MKVNKAYDIWAQTYDRDENPTRDLDARVLKDFIGEINNKIIIEAGCGTGKNTQWLSTFAKEIHAFDFSNEMLNIARKKIKKKNVKFFQQDITNPWPFKDSFADLVVINLVLEHIDNIQAVFDQAYRVLSPGGNFCLCELHPDKQKNGTQAKFINPDSKRIHKIDAFLHTKTEFNNTAIAAGFKKIVSKDWYDEKIELPRLISFLMEK